VESFAAIERLRRSAQERHEPMAEAALRFVLGTRGVDELVIAPRRPEHFASLGLAPQRSSGFTRRRQGRERRLAD
jgi:aryl-alcohol dehydrogenase-like predicted oxidoreductase